MNPVLRKSQMMANVMSDQDFAEWYVEDFMQVHLAESYYQISDIGKREMVIQGRAYARKLRINDPESQAHFVTLMWKIGANFWLQPGFEDIAQHPKLTGEEKIEAFYGAPEDVAIHAIMHPDERYWYPEMLDPDERAALP